MLLCCSLTTVSLIRFLLCSIQVEIQNKLKAIHNVIDMLTGIIGDSKEQAQKMVELDGDKVSPNWSFGSLQTPFSVNKNLIYLIIIF